MQIIRLLIECVLKMSAVCLVQLTLRYYQPIIKASCKHNFN